MAEILRKTNCFQYHQRGEFSYVFYYVVDLRPSVEAVSVCFFLCFSTLRAETPLGPYWTRLEQNAQYKALKAYISMLAL